MSDVSTPPVAPGAVIAHFGFDNSWEESIDVYTSIGDGTPVLPDRPTASLPAFSADVKGPLVFEGDPRTGIEAFSSNTASVAFSTGMVRVVEKPIHALGRKAFTAEWFVKFPAGDPMVRWAVIVDQVRENGSIVWAVKVDQGNRLYASFVEPTTQTTYSVLPSSGKKTMNDGRWHHVALTCSENEGEGTTSVHLYVDYDDYASGTVGCPLSYDTGRVRTVLRFATPSDANQRFLLDEFRYSDGVKPVEGFIRQGRGPQGVTLIVR